MPESSDLPRPAAASALATAASTVDVDAGHDRTAPLSASVSDAVGARSRRSRRRGEQDHPRERRPAQPPIRGRRVTRIVRRVQLWSVLKVALLGGVVFYLILLLAAGLLWSLATSTGQVHHIEKFMREIGFRDWSFDGGALFAATAMLGAVGVLAGSVFVTLAAALMNLISELTGGIRFTVIEVDPRSFEARTDPAEPPARR